MRLFLEELRRGSWKIEKAIATRLGLERIYYKIKEAFPTYIWLVEKIREKFNNEKRRFCAWITF